MRSIGTASVVNSMTTVMSVPTGHDGSPFSPAGPDLSSLRAPPEQKPHQQHIDHAATFLSTLHIALSSQASAGGSHSRPFLPVATRHEGGSDMTSQFAVMPAVASSSSSSSMSSIRNMHPGASDNYTSSAPGGGRNAMMNWLTIPPPPQQQMGLHPREHPSMVPPRQEQWPIPMHPTLHPRVRHNTPHNGLHPNEQHTGSFCPSPPHPPASYYPLQSPYPSTTAKSTWSQSLPHVPVLPQQGCPPRGLTAHNARDQPPTEGGGVSVSNGSDRMLPLSSQRCLMGMDGRERSTGSHSAPTLMVKSNRRSKTEAAAPKGKGHGGRDTTTPLRHQCPYKNCKYSALKKGTLKQHLVNVHHEGVTWFPCPKEGCSYTAKRKGTLKRHMAYVHNEGITWYYCEQPFCDYRAKQRSDMKLHTLKLHSTDYKSFACPIPGCSFKAKRNTLLARHMEKFHSDKPVSGSFATESQSDRSSNLPSLDSDTVGALGPAGLPLAQAA